MDAAAVYCEHAPAVRGYLRGQGVPDADDLLSDVFLQVTRSLPRFTGADAARARTRGKARAATTRAGASRRGPATRR